MLGSSAYTCSYGSAGSHSLNNKYCGQYLGLFTLANAIEVITNAPVCGMINKH